MKKGPSCPGVSVEMVSQILEPDPVLNDVWIIIVFSLKCTNHRDKAQSLPDILRFFNGRSEQVQEWYESSVLHKYP